VDASVIFEQCLAPGIFENRPKGQESGGFALQNSEFIRAASAIVRPENLFTEASDIEGFVNDWRDRYQGRACAVARPGSTDEVVALMRLCAEHGVPVVPQGGNTGLCGAATPDGSGTALVLWLGRMNRIRQLNEVDGCMVVEAGAVLQRIQEFAAEHGYFFPMSLGAEGSCQIGGNISTNAGGTAVLRYGPMRDLVLGLEVVLADGTLCNWLTPLRKNTTGYDLKHLFVGAEGTLGIVTAASVKVFPAPRHRESAMVSFEQIESALTLLTRLRTRLGDRLLSCEVINRAQVETVLTHMQGPTWPLSEVPPWALIIEVTETLDSYNLRDALEQLLGEALEDGIIDDAVLASSTAQQEALWSVRHNVSEANKRAGYGVTHDTAVPLSGQAIFVRNVERRLGEEFSDGQMLIVGHIGDGNLHVIHMLDPADYPGDALKTAAARINRIVDEETLALGGAISAEHGIGQSNKTRLKHSKGDAQIALMKRVKAAFDPECRMNPGKILD
jgi:FAD/FMN-containing dehydrogenase